MTTIAATAKITVTADTFVQEAFTGNVAFHHVRSNGTQRRIKLLTDEQERETSEWIMEQREAGVTMKELAAQLHVSVPTVRRTINRYLLTEEVELADTDEAAEWAEFATADPAPEDEYSPAPELEAALRASLEAAVQAQVNDEIPAEVVAA